MSTNELKESEFIAYVVVATGVRLSDYFKMAEGVVLRCDNTANRYSRANSVNALKRAIERTYGAKLEAVRVSYDETYGFLPRTEIRYRVRRAEQ